MKDLHYISIPHRKAILNAYARKYPTANNDYTYSDLDMMIFGYPRLRRMVDAGYEKADAEVDRERYGQYTPEWYVDVIAELPEPKDLNKYSGPLEEEEGQKEGEDMPDVTLEDMIRLNRKQVRDAIDEIMLNFDFESVQKAMEALGWHWGEWMDENADTHYDEVPNEYAIRWEAYRVLRMAIEDAAPVDCSGFHVVLELENPAIRVGKALDFKHQVKFGLQFIVSDWEADYGRFEEFASYAI